MTIYEFDDKRLQTSLKTGQDRMHMCNLIDIDRDLEQALRKVEAIEYHRREYIHRNGLNKNEFFTEYLARNDDHVQA